MSQFKNVDIDKAANVYFDGKVSSRTIHFPDGSRKTLGFMMAGDYEFGTEVEECMEALGGQAEVLLPGESEWKSYAPGESFIVPAKASFKLKIAVCIVYLIFWIVNPITHFAPLAMAQSPLLTIVWLV